MLSMRTTIDWAAMGRTDSADNFFPCSQARHQDENRHRQGSPRYEHTHRRETHETSPSRRAVKSNSGGIAGKLVKDLGHLAVNFGHPKKNTISIEIHHGARKDVATLRTVRSIINNMIIGVTKGFKYKMRYVYAHFPINVNLDQNKETGVWEVEIRNFIGEKIVRRVTMAEGVDVEISKSQKDELILTGNSLENVSQSAADIQQICKVRNKDIRKVRPDLLPRPCRRRHGCGLSSTNPTGARHWLRSESNMLTMPQFLDGLYVSEKGNVVEE